MVDYAGATDAILIGPGMATSDSVAALLSAFAPLAGDEATIVLDGAAAIALSSARRSLARFSGRLIITPHAGEMAALLDVEKEAVEETPADMARRAAQEFGAVVALKGPESWIADDNGTLLHFRGGSVGLGTSGSGDTLAGIVVGLAARGAPPLTATAWAVWTHAAAGRALSRRVGAVGFLARELLSEVPKLVGSDKGA
jgi:hydroxyethylthiazole kinase-like uncharacterized protein yjeF